MREWWRRIVLHIMVRIIEDNNAVTGQFLWEAIRFCVKVWCHLPGLHPWGLVDVLVVGPGLFPDKLRRSSACACAAAAVCRRTHRHSQFKHRKLLSLYVMSAEAGTSNDKKIELLSNPVKLKSAVSLCALFVFHRNVSSRKIQRIWSYITIQLFSIRHNPSFMGNPVASHTLLSVKIWEGWSAVIEKAFWYIANGIYRVVWDTGFTDMLLR